MSVCGKANGISYTHLNLWNVLLGTWLSLEQHLPSAGRTLWKHVENPCDPKVTSLDNMTIT